MPEQYETGCPRQVAAIISRTSQGDDAALFRRVFNCQALALATSIRTLNADAPFVPLASWFLHIAALCRTGQPLFPESTMNQADLLTDLHNVPAHPVDQRRYGTTINHDSDPRWRHSHDRAFDFPAGDYGDRIPKDYGIWAGWRPSSGRSPSYSARSIRRLANNGTCGWSAPGAARATSPIGTR